MRKHTVIILLMIGLFGVAVSLTNVASSPDDSNISQLTQKIKSLEKEITILKEKVTKLEKDVESLKKPAQEKKTDTGLPEGWKRVKEWQGSNTKTTEKFTVDSKWGLIWTTEVNPQLGWGYFAIEIYSADGKLIEMIGNTTTSESDVSYFHNAGTYYLKINTSQPYLITVIEHK